MALSHSPSIVTSGLVYCSDPLNLRSYPGSGTTLYDVSGSGSTGTLTNGPTYSSGYLTYDGVDDRVVTTAAPNYANASWEAWVYCTQNVSTYNMFMGDYLPYFGFYGGNSLYFSNIYGGAQQTIQTASNMALNTWYHAAFTTAYNGTNTVATVYTNGVQTASTTMTGQQGAPSGTFTIGDGQSMATWYPFKGNIGSVKIYNRTLSATEVLQNFNALRGRYGI
jgi:hypothetical protein